MKKSIIDSLVSDAARSAAISKMREAANAHLKEEVERVGRAVARAWVNQNKPALEKKIRSALDKDLNRVVNQLVKGVIGRIGVYVDD